MPSIHGNSYRPEMTGRSRGTFAVGYVAYVRIISSSAIYESNR